MGSALKETQRSGAWNKSNCQCLDLVHPGSGSYLNTRVCIESLVDGTQFVKDAHL